MEVSPYVGLDVSQETTPVCVVDQTGRVVWQGKCGSDPDSVAACIKRFAPFAVRVGLETGLLSNWLTRTLRQRRSRMHDPSFSHRRERYDVYPDIDAAISAFRSLASSKQRRGYSNVASKLW